MARSSPGFSLPPPSQPPSPLLCYLPVFRTPLFAFLDTRGIVTLLGTCHALRNDTETVAAAIDASPTTVRRLLRDSLRHWHDVRPTIELYPWTDRRGRRVAHDTQIPETAWPLELTPPARRGSLLSLAAMLVLELGDTMLSSTSAPNVTNYYVEPFIRPLARQVPPPRDTRAINKRPTALDCHLDNCTVADNATEATCTLCVAARRVVVDTAAYYATRGQEEFDLRAQLTRNGIVDIFSDVNRSQLAAFQASKAETDARYEPRDLDSTEKLRDAIERWGNDGRLPRVTPSLRRATVETLDEALHPGFYDPYYASGYWRFCATRLRPLVSLFHRNGLGRLESTRVRQFRGCDDWRDEIEYVQRVGATTPHGFVAGVYIVAMGS